MMISEVIFLQVRTDRGVLSRNTPWLWGDYTMARLHSLDCLVTNK